MTGATIILLACLIPIFWQRRRLHQAFAARDAAIDALVERARAELEQQRILAEYYTRRADPPNRPADGQPAPPQG